MELLLSALALVVVVYIVLVFWKDLPIHLGRFSNGDSAPSHSTKPKPVRPGPRPIQVHNSVPKPVRSTSASPELEIIKVRQVKSSKTTTEKVKSTRRVISDSVVDVRLLHDNTSKTREPELLHIPSITKRKRPAADLLESSDVAASKRRSTPYPAYDTPGAFPESPFESKSPFSSASATPESDYADSLWSTVIKSTPTTPPTTPPSRSASKRGLNVEQNGKRLERAYFNREYKNLSTPCMSDGEASEEEYSDEDYSDEDYSDEDYSDEDYSDEVDSQEDESELYEICKEQVIEGNDNENGVDFEVSKLDDASRVVRRGDTKENPITFEDSDERQSPLAHKNKNQVNSNEGGLNPKKKSNRRVSETIIQGRLTKAGVVVHPWDKTVIIAQGGERDIDVKAHFRRSWKTLDRTVKATQHLHEEITGIIGDYRRLKVDEVEEAKTDQNGLKQISSKVKEATQNVIHEVERVHLELRGEIATTNSSKLAMGKKGKMVVNRPRSSEFVDTTLSCKEIAIVEKHEDDRGALHYRGNKQKKPEEGPGDHESEDMEESENHKEWHEPIWQALYFCVSHGIINKILRKGQTENHMAYDGEEIIAMVEMKQLSSELTGLWLRKTQTYYPDGMYGYHSDVFLELPSGHVFVPPVAYEVCLPFFCCELKPVQKPNKQRDMTLEVENQIKERMMHSCMIYHKLEEDANFPRGQIMSSLPAIGFTSIGPDFTFWMMIRYPNPDTPDEVVYDLRKTWTGNIFNPADLIRLIANIHNIRRHAYRERKALIDECIRHASPGWTTKSSTSPTPQEHKSPRKQSPRKGKTTELASSSKSNVDIPSEPQRSSIRQAEKRKAGSKLGDREPGANNIRRMLRTKKRTSEFNCIMCLEIAQQPICSQP